MRLLIHWLTLVLGLYLISLISPLGIGFDRPADLLWAAFILMIFNAIPLGTLVEATSPRRTLPASNEARIAGGIMKVVRRVVALSAA